MNKHQQLVSFILDNIGGKENVLTVTHCMTRLRFTLKDDLKVNEEILLASPEIMTAQRAGGRYQVVIGTHVAQVFQCLQGELGISMNAEKEEKKGALNKLIDIITRVITPVLGILVASGLLQGILAILVVSGALSTDDGAYIILHAMGQTAFYFLPVVLGYTSAKVFNLNPFVGMMLGAALIIPELMNNLTTGDALYTLFAGTIFETPVYKTFFGFPIIFPEHGYQATLIPIIFITFFASKVDRVLKKIVPDIIAHNLNAFLLILITIPLAILIIGPITNVLSVLIEAGVSSLYTLSPMFTTVVVALLYQPLVILGLHWPLGAIGISNLALNGSDYILPMSFTANFAQTAVVLAVFLRTKSKQQKVLAVPAMVSGTFCIIEPAIYGFSLPVKKRFAFAMIGGAVGSIIMALFSTKMYAFSFGILGFASFINPETGSLTGLYVALFASLATMVVAFSLTYFTFNEKEDANSSTSTDEMKKLITKEAVLAPMTGICQPLSTSQDPTFAKGSLGKGIVIKPTKGEVIAPVDGTITAVFPGGHAIGLVSESGIEVLVHVGVDTVELHGQGFQTVVKQGQKVQAGELLCKADLIEIQKAGFSSETMVVITNSDQYLDVVMTKEGKVKKEEEIMAVVPFTNEHHRSQDILIEKGV